jgi:hypothetical protein
MIQKNHANFLTQRCRRLAINHRKCLQDHRGIFMADLAAAARWALARLLTARLPPLRMAEPSG